ncbi:UDP-N-acetylmuramoyl-tripeptide--D-alanyl-D-alanine ligase, partial [Rhodococcus erythropolis]|jgi:UDP-N-acetylmuramoyl-tripeptide--D-alanyl-D-alanine ligase|nr:UDP-N-acetylmuramoyl-tripeptide--D-alanyl-D-alanine ligase [Rhodococcus erythropolis]
LIVVGTGRTSRAMHQGAVMEGSWGDESVVVPDAAAAIAILEAELEPGDLVLVKASKSVELWTVAEAILAATPSDNTGDANTDGENGGDSQ